MTSTAHVLHHNLFRILRKKTVLDGRSLAMISTVIAGVITKMIAGQYTSR